MSALDEGEREQVNDDVVFGVCLGVVIGICIAVLIVFLGGMA